ncbi:MAG: hypothetical protein M3Q23_18010 [Actinomycetota bacterium]|nr:hypothetical protein [Actinomycetota bacterium]
MSESEARRMPFLRGEEIKSGALVAGETRFTKVMGETTDDDPSDLGRTNLSQAASRSVLAGETKFTRVVGETADDDSRGGLPHTAGEAVPFIALRARLVAGRVFGGTRVTSAPETTDD